MGIPKKNGTKADPSRCRLCGQLKFPVGSDKKVGERQGPLRYVCRTPGCLNAVGVVRWVPPFYPDRELFPRPALDWHCDEDDPGFDNAVRLMEDYCD